MKHRYFILASLLLHIVFIMACEGHNSPSSYPAQLRKDSTGYILVLKKEKQLHKHDARSVIKNGKYLDSILLQLPRDRGIISGKEIPVRKGYYKFKGKIVLTSTSANVKLYYDNYDDKTIDDSGWNGIYRIKR